MTHQRKAPAGTGADRHAIVESFATSSLVAFRGEDANGLEGGQAFCMSIFGWV